LTVGAGRCRGRRRRPTSFLGRSIIAAATAGAGNGAEASGAAGGSARAAEIGANLDRLRARIAAACTAAGRDPSEITLVAVTKTYPAADVAHLATLGVRDIGENREQEAAPKVAEIAAAGIAVRWHHVGQLQRNKARAVAGYAYAVHSVDRVRLVDALGTARDANGLAPLEVFVQLSIDGDIARGGALAADVPVIAEAVAGQPALRLAGLMAVAPLGMSAEAAFDLLAAESQRLRVTYPEATSLSAGMSNDLDAAIARGATHVRVGSALLGMRPKLG
jgi:pyridoxal phosphate enzyme (YggS family)